MYFNVLVFFLMRVLLPLILLLAIFLRPVILSATYLLAFFLSPFVPLFHHITNMKYATIYFIILMGISFLMVLCQTCFFTIGVVTRNAVLFETCSHTEQLLRHLGFVSAYKLNFPVIVQWIIPDILVLLVSVTCFGLMRFRLRKVELKIAESTITQSSGEISSESESYVSEYFRKTSIHIDETTTFLAFTISKLPFLCLLAFLFSGILRPSLLGFFYFIIFLSLGTYMASYHVVQKKFCTFLKFVLFVMAVHITMLFAYQLPWMQEKFLENAFTVRLFGFSALLKSICEVDIRIIKFQTKNYTDAYFNIVALTMTYLLVATTVVWLPKYIDAKTEFERTSADKKERKSSGKPPTVSDHILYGLWGLGNFIYTQSYILMNGIMMVWAIVYHSWLTFILLFWANFLWILPNQRKAMKLCSFFIVGYAEILLIIQYVYSMNFKEEELPASYNSYGINLNQIGFYRPQDSGGAPSSPLMLKTIFLFSFWITLRSFSKEKMLEQRGVTRTSTLGYFSFRKNSLSNVANFRKARVAQTSVVRKFGIWIGNFIVRLWLWGLIFFILILVINGTHVTAFRTCYMGLVLLFVIIFQISTTSWLRIMYGFWLFMIFYSMSVLILIYTYQFDKFDMYWEYYFSLPKLLQDDIGLERYRIKDLFLQLLPPTCIIIMTVIQVQHFHKRFVVSIQVTGELPPPAVKEIAQMESSSQEKKMPRKVIKDILNMIRNSVVYMYTSITNGMKRHKAMLWNFLEFHWIKIVYISAFISCVREISIIHLPILVLCLIGVMVENNLRILIIPIITIFVALIILSKMVYQLEYLDHSRFNVYCAKYNTTYNNAVWFGLNKKEIQTGLMDYLHRYVIYILVSSLHALILMRQRMLRRMLGEQKNKRTKVLFPGVTRESAEEDTEGLIKFLLNYGFYKFGYEICLILITFTIAYRDDIIAIAYCIWLILLLALKRPQIVKIWQTLRIFTVCSIIIQFLILVFFPRYFCVDFPWYNSVYSDALQRWGLLPGYMLADFSKKLTWEYIVMITIHHQYWNFKYEAIPKYPGGSNNPIDMEMRKMGANFVNPTHDFLSTTRNASDLIKFACTPGFYWLTLAIVFIAGAHINDVLAIGYFVGAFIFLWEGSDYYLRPIRSIKTRWFAFIIFCVINMVARRSLQLIGCIFISFLNRYCCWLIHLFGINCSTSMFLMSADSEFNEGQDSCPAVSVEVVVTWDAICFAFLIIQYRIFSSYYFLHVINDTKASYILASRGASIIERLRLRELKLRLDREKQVLNKIKEKMDKLRSAQQRNADEKAAALAERGIRRDPHKMKALLTHPNAIRSGDYYMFEEDEEKFELEMIPQTDNLFQGGSVEPTKSELRILKMRIAKPRLAQSGVHESKTASSRYLQYTQDDLETEAEPQKVKHVNPVKRLLTNFLVLLTVRLNRLSHNYRYVNKILTAEKKGLKELDEISSYEDPVEYRARQLKKLQGIVIEIENSRKDHNIIVEFLISIWYLLLSNTELICYVIVFAHKIVNYGFFSLPLPLLVFLWGTLSVPRPTKTFWICLITYSMAIVMLKCVLQFDFIWSNRSVGIGSTSFDFTDLTGISQDRNYATSDLCLLLSLFIHRYMLKWYGLWKVEDVHERTIHRSLFHEFEEKVLRRDDRRRRHKEGGSSKSTEKEHTSPSKHSSKYEESSDELAKSKSKRYSKGVKKFFRKLLNKARLPVDVYALMFICDFINFFVLFFGFNAFGKSRIDDDEAEDAVKSVLSQNRVPVPFLIMLFVQFSLIVIDRILYLRKALKCKICFHYFSVVGTHIWMFIVVPMVTEAPFAASIPPVIFYVVKCIYLLLSAYQIRCGYPKRILGNFITRGFSLINMVAFNIYRQIPFLYELRTVLDWLCTDTTMSLFEWMKMEDIYSKIYSLRCIREYESDFPSPRGIKKETRSKLFLGGLFFIILVGLIWAPLSLFALFNAVGVPNIPNEVSFSIRLGSYDPIYSVRSRENVIVFTQQMYDVMKEVYEGNKLAQAFLLNYDAADVAAIKLSGNSPSMWNIAPPDRDKLINTLKMNTTVTARLTYKLERKSDANYASAVVDSEISFEMNNTYPYRDKLISMLEGTATNTDLIIPEFIPKFIKITSSSRPTYVSALMFGDTIRNLMLNIRNNARGGGPSWWEISDTCEDDDISMTLQKLPLFACDSGVVIYTFNEKKFPSTLRILTAKGIMGLYTTFVLLASRLIRSIASNYSSKIINDELPNVDRILQLCLDIYLVREAMEFILEEDLFSKLIFLYRSPETMIKWTRPPEPEMERLPPPTPRPAIQSA